MAYMVIQELAQRAVLEALEAKIEALRALGQLSDGVTLELYFWDDLGEKHQAIFREATVEDVKLAISVVEGKSDGRFKLLSLNPATANRNVLRVALTIESGRPIIDVSNLYWKIQYTEAHGTKESLNSEIFWLTPRELQASISNEKRSVPLRAGSVQHRLLEWFSEHKGFTKSKELARELDTTLRTIATEVAKLRQKADTAFGLDENNFIESSQGEGYRLGKSIKIKPLSDAS
jgi:hypothetical protein